MQQDNLGRRRLMVGMGAAAAGFAVGATTACAQTPVATESAAGFVPTRHGLERQEVLDVLHSERFVDQAPAQVAAALLDEERYLCSVRTMYRILDANQEVRERRNQRVDG